MGMFDYVRCEIPLPDGFTGELQSKDFDCRMTTIVIRKDKRLYIEDCEYERVPDAERSYHIRPINQRWRELNYHGIFNFYGDDKEGRWHDYNATFTDGELVNIAATTSGESP